MNPLSLLSERKGFLLCMSLCTLVACTKVPQKIVTAKFKSPDTLCNTVTLNLVNLSENATKYHWSFAQGSTDSSLTATNLSLPAGAIYRPVFSDYVKINDEYVMFVVNNGNGSITRLDFGTSLLNNSPVATYLGSLGAIQVQNEGFQIINANGNWYGLLVGGDLQYGTTPQVYKINFGTNLKNINPEVSTYPFSEFAQPIDLFAFTESSNWYGFTVNAENNTMARINFSSNLSNAPSVTTLSNITTLNYPTGICTFYDNSKWYAFITDGKTSKAGNITRLDFGTSLLSTPIVTQLGNVGNKMSKPRDMVVMRSGSRLLGYVVNADSSLLQLDFNGNIQNVPTVTKDYGDLDGKLKFPHAFSKIFTVDGDLYSFVPNVTASTLTRIKFPNYLVNTVPPTSTDKDPVITGYIKPGVYNICLTVDMGQPTEASYCKQITVVDCK
ncbi:hypothetical protein QEG73_16650 [Chitinophagaceae bacterium 26-R-25]|nr:hypothetical protein [Chitinophagaceae bacterium 26-R-25]